MNKVTINSELCRMLNGTDCKIELVDEAGRTLGFFVPTEDHERMMRALENDQTHYQWIESQVSEEEFARSMEDNELYTTEEVITYLESL